MKTRFGLAVALAALGLAGAAWADGKDAGGAEVTLKGEILDLHCYMLHPDTGKGPDHAKCANSCISRGLPVGFLADGKVYALLGQGHDAPTAMVAGKAGQPVELKGTLVEHGGMRAIQVSSVSGGDAAPAPKADGHDHAGHDHAGHDH